ncbi:L,D-transpeptidase [Brevibacillus humidisoli]|uniref:L,D-transpeptidase n=1 Tax=Brevibacillus humidisoli TaxID=2895522 RepID=UPI001E5E9036|nr:L,D-transpeptidase [Brevibacillus humidisoli]UFJ39361.1 L,D-transpeptidase [Brevibacillus humidisoli]
MNKAQFLQEKIAYLIRYPGQTELDFYRHLTERYPTEAVGWFHLGEESERHGDRQRALQYYRQAIHGHASSEFHDLARQAYRRLLKERRQRRWKAALRRLLSLAVLTLLLSLLPHPTLAPVLEQTDQNAAVAAQTSGVEKDPVQHTEVIAVPPGLTGKRLQAQVKHYLASRRLHFTVPFTVILVPETGGLPSFTPLLFYRPTTVKGIIRFDPTSNKLIAENYYDPACECADQPPVADAKRALSEEQQTLEQVLLMRNALYRTYQQTGRLPGQLQDLTKPTPANRLSALPRLAVPAKLQHQSAQTADLQWAYRPDRFRPDMAWDSLSEVLPLPYYAEPTIPLDPLRILVHKPSHRLLLTSGPHLVRQYPIGIGKNDSTPDGYFTILQKMNYPAGAGNIYGSRGMTFFNTSYAIHGTNDPDSIGKAKSLGCIRLHNADVEELYSFVSPGTDVIISSQAQPLLAWTNGARQLIPAGSHEKTPGVTYHWLH